MMKKISLKNGIIFIFSVLVTVMLSSKAYACERGHHSNTMTKVNNTPLLKVTSAWSPVTLPTIKTSAVYLKLSNFSKKSVTIVGVKSTDFAMAHLHRTTMIDGLVSMQAIEQLSIPAGGISKFEPGGLHIMLIGAKKNHKVGDQISIGLQLQDGRQLIFKAEVMQAKEGPSNHDHHMHGKHNS